MKILIIHQAYYPEMSGTARRAKELAESFVSNGHIVQVLTSTPRSYRSFPDYKYKLFETFNGVSIFRIKTLLEVNKNVFFRMISYFLFCIQSLKLAIQLSKQSDIIISIAPLSSGILGSLAKKFSKKHHHFDVPDMLPDLGIAAGMLKNEFLINFLYKIEKWVYNNSNTISGCTKGHVKAIKNKGVNHENISWIPDWIDASFFKENKELFTSEVNRLYSFEGKKVISFIGNIGALQKPDTFIEVMKLLKKEDNDDLLFCFVGDGIMLPALKKMVKNYNLNNVRFLGRVKREHIPSIMDLSNVLVTNYVPDPHLDLYVPGKLFEYAISRKPIVMGSNGDAKDLIEKYNLGISVAPSDIISFKKAILTVSDINYKFNPDIKKFKSDYSINNIISLYNNVLKKIKLNS